MRERGKLETARSLLKQGLKACKPAAIGDLGIGTSQTIEEEGYVLAIVSLAWLRFANGEAFQDNELEALGRRCSPGLERYVKLHQVRLWLANPDLIPDGFQRAIHWAEGQVLNPADPIWDWDHEIPTLLTLVRVRLAQATISSLSPSHSQWQKIQRFLKAQNKICIERGWIERVIEIHILEALAYQGSAQTGLALEALVKAFNKANNQGYQRLFLDEGRLLQVLIYQAIKRGIAPESARVLLLSRPEETFTLIQKPAKNSMTGLPLTRREIEVLELIAAGLTNAEICQALSIALGTVKRHIANINLKLDTHNRTQAVARARLFGILNKN
jgi:LuxR family maltose regulon positive regulatory protein